MPSIEAIIDRQLKRWELQKLMAQRKPEEKPGIRPIITVSRGLGAGGEEAAAKLSELTGFQLMDREVLDAIVNDVGFQSRMVEMLDEDARSELESWVYGMITGRIVDRSDYLKSLTKIIGSVLKYGETIIVGRGANIIIGKDRGFHVRITASPETRAENLTKCNEIQIEEAKTLVDESDKKRQNFIRKSFGADIDDPVLYDLVINTDSLDINDAVELALLAYGKKEKVLRERKTILL